MRCHNCGWENPDGIQKCEKCNAPLWEDFTTIPPKNPLSSLNTGHHYPSSEKNFIRDNEGHYYKQNPDGITASFVCFSIESWHLYQYEYLCYNYSTEDVMKKYYERVHIKLENTIFEIPREIEYNGKTYPIVRIKSGAFAFCKINAITIPNSVAYIEAKAFFRCDGLEELIIPDSVKELSKGAILECRNLIDITWQGITYANDSYEPFIFPDHKDKYAIKMNDNDRIDPKCAIEYTPEYISQLAPNEIFVFGSNLEGMHGGGAARYAYEHFGAQWGKGVGMAGQTYAIPTMQGGVETIKTYVDEFIRFARKYPQCKFLVTPIGCGIAGFTPQQIAPLFKEAFTLQNVTLPKEFCDVLLTQEFKQCAKGHYYIGSGNCPYCGSEEAYVPRCPYCGEPLKKSIPVVSESIGSLEGNAYDHKVPWNYGWDGVCENCGHDFNIKIMQNHERMGIARETTIQVSGKSIETSFRDIFIGLSGVEIKQQTKEGLVTMFISTNELQYLWKALRDSPILDQWDWREDRT